MIFLDIPSPPLTLHYTTKTERKPKHSLNLQKNIQQKTLGKTEGQINKNGGAERIRTSAALRL